MRGSTSPHTTHDLHSARICYPFHPFHGVEVEVVRHVRRIESSVLIVKLPGGTQIALPEWMLTPQACDGMKKEDSPRIAIDALFDLRRLIDSQQNSRDPHGRSCAESPSGGQDAQQRESDCVAAQIALRGRKRALGRASGTDEGTVPRLVAPTIGKRSQDRRREAK